jgi:penicillin-binding protein 1A
MTRPVKILWIIFLSGLLFVVLLFVAADVGVFGKMPSLTELENPDADLASEIYSSDGLLMGKYFAENRTEIKYDQISPNIIHALVATEDERFYDHSGIDAKAVARVFLKLGRDGGGSPITQQLAKMMLKQGHGGFLKRSVDKIKEWIIAVKLERNFTKEEILTLYLNRAPWGYNYGIRNASRTYFQKEPADLSVEEAAVLVGMLKGFVYDPIRHPKASFNRRNTVIQRMVDCKEEYLTQDEADKLKAMPLVTNFKKSDDDVGIAPYFRQVLADRLKDWCKDHRNPKTGESYDLYRDGLKIYTTIDSKMQDYAEQSVIEHMPIIQQKLNALLKTNGSKMWKGHDNVIDAAMKESDRWKNMEEDSISDDEIAASFTIPVKMKVFAWNAARELDTVMTPRDSIKYHKQLMQTSFVCMDPRTGEVKCWVGGIDFKWFKFDHVTALRQVGSTFKPLLYTLAVQDAGYTPQTLVPGGTICLSGKCITGGGGTLAYGLAHSKNPVAYRLMSVIGPDRLVEFAHTCGIKSFIPDVPSIALGTAEVPMLEMLRAYTMFPNKGYNTEPILVTRIEDKDGNILQEFVPETKQVISEVNAYTMVKLMEGVVDFGTGHSLKNYNIPVRKAGKTGTTNDNTDGWFIGYTPELLAGTWVGCDDQFLKIYSGTSGGNEMALPKWGNFMTKVYADKKLPYGKILDFPEPPQALNNPEYADLNAALFNQTDSTSYPEDQGNGDAGDYADPSSTDDYGTNDEAAKTDVRTKVVKDTGKEKAKKPVSSPPKSNNDF